MRSPLLLFALQLICNPLFSRGVEYKPSYYEIVSDHYQPDMEAGYFQVIGVVKNVTNQHPVPGATVINKSLSTHTISDAEGTFSLKLPVTDSSVFCYAGGYGELEIKGPFKSKHVIHLRIFLEEQIAVVFKPVIYAYNSDQPVTLSLKPQGHFTFTYPQTADGSWKVITNADGSITNQADGKKYPYLFWEAEQAGLKITQYQNVAEGFLVQTDTCISFLENTLAAYGLNEKESTDFITFWGPKMIEKEYAFVQFLSTEQYGNAVASLDVQPQPESMLRLYMYLVLLDNTDVPFEVSTPEIEPFERAGFTVVEWGGSVLKLTPVIN